MGRILLILRLVAGAFAFVIYVWFAAVRALPLVRLRKRLRRSRRGTP